MLSWGGREDSIEVTEPYLHRCNQQEWCENPTWCSTTEWCRNHSDIDVTLYKVTWTLDGTHVYDSKMSNCKKTKISSAVFEVGKNDSGKLRACISFYPKGVNGKSEKPAIYLQPMSSVHSFLHARLEVTISKTNIIQRGRSTELTILAKCETLIEFDSLISGLGWGFADVTLAADPFDSSPITVIKCTIWYSDKKPTSNLIQDYQALSNNLLQMLKDGEYSDVTLRVGNEVLKAHKAILSSRSPVFAAMLNANMAERATGVIVIDDIELEVMKSLLYVIYSGRVNNEDVLDEDMATKLLRAVDKYDISGGLKVKCCETLASCLNIQNAANMFHTAIQYNAEQLRTDAELFIRRELEEVSETEGWKLLTSSCPDVIVKTFLGTPYQ